MLETGIELESEGGEAGLEQVKGSCLCGCRRQGIPCTDRAREEGILVIVRLALNFGVGSRVGASASFGSEMDVWREFYINLFVMYFKEDA